ncbi:MAG: glycerophosphodiester phosphodiesterase family protein [FCB group bacterium]|nr:glycerophosphodiester phosphodiesterase family protein [FCB group bacterium]
MKKVLFVAGLLLILTGGCENANQGSIEKLTPPVGDNVLVVAHRGYWRTAPENSLQAIKNSIDIGVDIVEIDVRRTKDKRFILMHDETVDRTTNGSGKVEDYTLDSLKQLYLKDAAGSLTKQKIPTLKEVMLLAKGRILVNLDKSENYISELYELLRETGTVQQAIFKGSKPVSIVRQEYGSLLDSIIYMPIVNWETSPTLDYINEFEKGINPIAYEVIYQTENSPIIGYIKTIKENKDHVWVNTLWASLCAGHDDDKAVENPDEAWGWVIQNGATILQTDRPKLMLSYLRKKGWHR